jgi:anti-anti-sigma factor
MSTPLTLSTGRRDDGTLVLTATGEIDLSNVDTFNQALADAMTTTDQVTVDLRDVHYLDSGGINALFHHADNIRVIANATLMPLLTISGLTQLVTVEQDRPSPQAREE